MQQYSINPIVTEKFPYQVLVVPLCVDAAFDDLNRIFGRVFMLRTNLVFPPKPPKQLCIYDSLGLEASNFWSHKKSFLQTDARWASWFGTPSLLFFQNEEDALIAKLRI